MFSNISISHSLYSNISMNQFMGRSSYVTLFHYTYSLETQNINWVPAVLSTLTFCMCVCFLIKFTFCQFILIQIYLGPYSYNPAL